MVQLQLAEGEQNREVRDEAWRQREAVADDEAQQIGDREHEVDVVEGEYERPAIVAKAGQRPLFVFAGPHRAELGKLHRLLQRLRTLANERLEHLRIAA